MRTYDAYDTFKSSNGTYFFVSSILIRLQARVNFNIKSVGSSLVRTQISFPRTTAMKHTLRCNARVAWQARARDTQIHSKDSNESSKVEVFSCE